MSAVQVHVLKDGDLQSLVTCPDHQDQGPRTLCIAVSGYGTCLQLTVWQRNLLKCDKLSIGDWLHYASTGNSFHMQQAKCFWLTTLYMHCIYSVQVLVWIAVWFVHLPGRTCTSISKPTMSNCIMPENGEFSCNTSNIPSGVHLSLATSDQVYGCRWTGWPNTVKRMASLHAVAVLKWHMQ